MGRPSDWVREVTGRAPMRSPGHPGHQRVVERAFWDEIARGDLPTECAVAVDVSPVAGTRWFRDAGGMSPYSWSPPSGRFLSFAEREEIALLRARGSGVRQIAAALGRSPSTISRELRRNAATRGGKLDYRASVAQWKGFSVLRGGRVAGQGDRRTFRPRIQCPGIAVGVPHQPAGARRTGSVRSQEAVEADRVPPTVPPHLPPPDTDYSAVRGPSAIPPVGVR